MTGRFSTLGSRRPHLVHRGKGGLAGDLADLRADIAAVMDVVELPPERVRYCDVSTPVPTADQDGSIARPYALIQSAIDDIEANVDTTTEAAGILVAGGEYKEQLVICTATCIMLQGYGRSKVVRIDPDAGVSLTITNATKASLAAYRVSGDYSDLVNNGPGPRDISIKDMYIHGWGAESNHSLELLGVKGDASATTTSFLDAGGPLHQGCMFFNCSFDRSMFARNAAYPFFSSSYIGAWEFQNCSCPGIEHCLSSAVSENNVIGYTTSHTYGEPAYGNQGFTADYTILQTNITVEDEAYLGWDGWPISIETFGSLILTDTAAAYIRRLYLSGDFTAAADCEAKLSDPHIEGDVTLTNGTGTIVFQGGQYMGDLTDTGGRLTHNLGHIGS